MAKIQSAVILLPLLLTSYFELTDAQEGGGSQTCVSTYAQATCMGPWFGWNEPSHLNQGSLILGLRRV